MTSEFEKSGDAVSDTLNIANTFLFDRLPAGQGTRVALVVDDEAHGVSEYSYADVAARTELLAALLSARGLLPENRVILAAQDGLDFVAAFFAILKLGAVVVMVNPELPEDELDVLFGYTRARLAFTDHPSVAAAAERALLCLGAFTSAHAKPDELAVVPTFPTHPDDPAIWLFSGGTSGRPKAVVQTHYAFLNTTRLYAHGVLGYHEDDITLSVPKLFFGYATGSNLLFPFSVGARAVLFPEKVTAERVATLIERHRPTILINVPTFVGRLLDLPGDRDFSSLRVSTSAGEALPEPLFHRFRERFGVELLDGLGTAEMWHIFLSNRPGRAIPGTLGEVVPGFEVLVCDDAGNPVPDGEVGFLRVKGRSRALGYVHAHARSCAAFLGPWYVSEDMVSRSPEGVFTYCGRGDDMLKIGGRWVAPRDVEAALAAHPDVAECAVVGVKDDAGLVKPWAWVRLREAGRAVTERELLDFLHTRLPAFKVPRHIEFVDQFPRTHLNKIDRGRLRRADARSPKDPS
ncbi:MAG: benzoate-CoA ligase family protein [Myxococcales bacterium]|nr:benzoate-CoA ligase family protein [Myxococcales bacterium]